MSRPVADVDLDALAPKPITAKLGGQVYQLPGDMPMPLFIWSQGVAQRIEAGEEESALLQELHDELLALFQVYQPDLKRLPTEMGVLTLMQALGQLYGGGEGKAPPPNRATRRSRPRTRTASPKATGASVRATSR